MSNDTKQSGALPGQKRSSSTLISRRTILIWLVGAAAAETIASGTTWQKFIHALQALFTPHYDLPGGHLLLSYGQPTHPINSLAWSPDGKTIASGSADKTVRVWNASSGKTLLTYRGHTDVVNSLAWSPNGTRVASASQDGTVQIW